jgi:hypothetical protein
VSGITPLEFVEEFLDTTEELESFLANPYEDEENTSRQRNTIRT